MTSRNLIILFSCLIAGGLALATTDWVGSFGIILFIIGIVGIVWIIGRVQWILRKIRQARSKGIDIQNEGMALATEQNLNYWVGGMEKWRDSIYGKLKMFDRNEADRFYTLGKVDVSFGDGARFVNSEHKLRLGCHIKRLEILENIRDRLMK